MTFRISIIWFLWASELEERLSSVQDLYSMCHEKAHGVENFLRQYNVRRFDLFVSYVQGLRDF